MAKRKTSKPKAAAPPSLPSVEVAIAEHLENAPPEVIDCRDSTKDQVLVAGVDVGKETVAVSTAVLDEPSIPVVMKALEVPFATVQHGYEPRRCDVQQLTSKQRAALRRIANGLIARGDTLANGRQVRVPQDAVKWILENVESM